LSIQFTGMKKIFCGCLFYFPFIVFAQSLGQRLTTAVDQLQSDEQFKHAAIAAYVLEAKTGKVVFDKNAEMGMVPASCQKLFTSVAAFSMLGKDYRFKTEIGYDGVIKNGVLDGHLIIKGYGDPSLGSSRFSMYDHFYTLDLFNSIPLAGIKEIKGMVYADDGAFEFQTIPAGWVWEDIGNYYGAGVAALNWNENSYTLPLRSGKNIGDTVLMISQSGIQHASLLNNLTSAKAGSGDNSIIYLPPHSDEGSIEGTIPINENRFVIKGSIPDPTGNFLDQLKIYLDYHKIRYDKSLFNSYYKGKMYTDTLAYHFKKIYTQYSPSFDSINYWFLKKSVNLYGEALVKAMAYEKDKLGSTAKGIGIIKDFWSKNGIEKSALHIIDGSGLSPANRVTTKALVTILQYAQRQSWFSSFYTALPEMNGIKMKDGYIGGVRAYAGYVNAGNGAVYIFSFVVNNFDGSPATAREKIWRIFDLLK